jgi:hypothetical protein
VSQPLQPSIGDRHERRFPAGRFLHRTTGQKPGGPCFAQHFGQPHSGDVREVTPKQRAHSLCDRHGCARQRRTQLSASVERFDSCSVGAGMMVERQPKPIPQEIASAFSWAVGVYSLSWSPGGPEPTTVLYGQHFTITEISHLVDNFHSSATGESPRNILSRAHEHGRRCVGVETQSDISGWWPCPSTVDAGPQKRMNALVYS